MKRNVCRAVLPPGGFASFHFYTTHYNGSVTPAISTSGRGRPRAFDRNEALKAALRVFWQRGYAPASVAELCKAMGSNAPSLYAAFGSKAGLFLEALHFYENSYWDEPAQRLLAGPNLFAERLHRAVQDGQLAAECNIDAIAGKPELEAARELGAAIT